MSEKKKMGRPPSGREIREAQVRFFLTPEDAAWFDGFARDLGFKSHSEFWTAIAERLLLGRLAPFVWLKLGYQIAKRSSEVGATKGGGFYNPFEPLPPLPVDDRRRPKPVLPEEELAASESKALLSNLRKELQTK